MINSGLCSCIHCKPLKFRSKGIWILREINLEFETDIMYVTCREFYSKKLKNMFIGEYHIIIIFILPACLILPYIIVKDVKFSYVL